MRSCLVMLLLGAALGVRPSVALAQEPPDLDPQYQTWLGVFAQGPITGNLFFQGDLHYRVFSNFQPNWLLVRPALGYRLMDGMFVTIGYAWTPSWAATTANLTDEHRAWEQWQWELTDAGSGVKFQIRSRLEQRFRESPAAGQGGFGLRFRQLVRVSVPLDPEKRWTYVLWDEVFAGLSESGWQHLGLDQNRFFGGIGYQIVPGNVRLEVGYMQQWLVRPGRDVVNHTLTINTYLSWR